MDRKPSDEPGPEGSKAPAEVRDVSAELSALLVELARAPEQDVDVAQAWVPELAPGDEIGRFVLRRELGRGGFGVVYEAFDRELGRPVAFKALRPGRRIAAKDVEWLRGEAEAVARLNHPNIVTLYDFGRGPSGPYLIFELLRGETLADRLRGGRLPLPHAVAVASDIARVLAHAHAAGVVHRDLKPANVFLCSDGTVKVLDFGLAHLFGSAGSVSGGTPSHMAPEQWRHEPGDQRSDLFSLGVLLFQMVTGRIPYRVTRDGSEAQGPGPPPELPRGAAPPALQKLSGALLQKDPTRRPAAAQDVVAVLADVGRRLERRGRPRVVWAAALATLALAAGAALLHARAGLEEEGERLVLAVADFENGTGERELDGLSGLLVTSLEQSPRFRVLTRSRLLAIIGRSGRPDAPRVEAELARELARTAGAEVLLAGTARTSPGGEYALQLRALEPATGRRIFSMSEVAPTKAEVLGAIDRLSAAVRRELREGPEDVRRKQIRVAQAITSSPEAYQAYFDGLDCVERPSRSASWVSFDRACAEHFRAALRLDPTFALAHYQLAVLLTVQSIADPEIAPHMASALLYADRVPRKEAGLIRAWEAHLAGRDEEALALYGTVLSEFPDEKQALFQSGEIRVHRGELALAVPFFEKILALDPGDEWALDSLVNALGALRRHGELRSLLARLGAGPAAPATSHAIVHGLVWLGDRDGALRAARDAVDSGFGPAAEKDLLGVLAASLEVREVEAILRRRVEGDPARFEDWVSLALVLFLQGRRAEALAVLERAGGLLSAAEQGDVQYVRAMSLAADPDLGVRWREAARAKALAPEFAGMLAVPFALFGDLPHAAELASLLSRRPTAAEEYEALVAWRSGDGAGAAARLAALDARDPWPTAGFAPSYLLAEVSAALRDWRGTLSAVERFRSLWPRGPWRSWAVPRSFYLAALAHAELGEVDAAHAELDVLLGVLERADPGHPLAREALGLRSRLRR